MNDALHGITTLTPTSDSSASSIASHTGNPTLSSITVVVAPSGLLAVTVYAFRSADTLPSPNTLPVASSIDSPDGSAGATANVTLLPVTAGKFVENAEPTRMENAAASYAKPEGGAIAQGVEFTTSNSPFTHFSSIGRAPSATHLR